MHSMMSGQKEKLGKEKVKGGGEENQNLKGTPRRGKLKGSDENGRKGLFLTHVGELQGGAAKQEVRTRRSS